MKKPLLLGIIGITLIALTATTLYAQTAIGTSLVDKMKAAVHTFTLSADLNAGQTGFESAPIAGKKTGGILTAGEWNRVLELVSEGGSGGGGSGWVDVPLTDTADFDDSCMYRYQITYSAGGREPYVPKETYYYANGMSKTQLVWWLENDSQNTTYHIAASSKNLLRINGNPYTTGGVSVTKIEKLCGGGVGGSGSGWTNVSLTDTADFDTTCLYEAQFKTTDSTNNNLMNGDTSWRTGTIRGNKYLGFSFTDGSSATFSLWGIGSSNKNVYGYRDASGTFFPVNSVSVLSMRRLCGGGGGSSVNSDDYSRAKAIRASGFTLNIPSGITDWPDTIVCDGFGGWAGGRQILTLDFTGNNVVGYTQAEGVGVYFNPSTGVLAQADRVGSCGASNIATICAAGRCIK